MLDEFLDTVSMTQRMGVAIDQPGKENHSIRVYRDGLLARGKIGSTTHEGNASILDPEGLAFDKLPRKRIEESPIDENGIRGSVAGNCLITYPSLIHLSHIQRITKYKIGVKARRGVRGILGNDLRRMPGKQTALKADESSVEGHPVCRERLSKVRQKERRVVPG